MKKQLLLYLDNCVYSKLLEPNSEKLRRNLSNMPHRVAFSEIHLIEMQGNRDAYTKLLDDLNAVFVRNPGAAENRYHPISSIESGDASRRFSEHFEFAPIFDAFEVMLAPLQHFMGGRRGCELQEIADSTADGIKASLKDLFSSVSVDNFEAMMEIFAPQINEARKSLLSVNVAAGLRRIEAHLKVARDGDPMRDMQSSEKVDYLFSILDETEREELEQLFPKHFANHKILNNGEMAGFAFMLFGMGLTKRKGIFSGSRQEQKFAAQFRDAQHIEEASRCDLFITFDRGASQLAAASFAYAGFPTRAFLLTES